jgi:AcrR family transcriptional regulator
MARLAERLGCGTMSLYRHVANKDELLTFMLSTAPDPPPSAADPSNWLEALAHWAKGLWDVYHRHPWVLQTAAAGPPLDPGQLAWLDAGLAALDIEAAAEGPDHADLLRRLVVRDRFPALAAAVAAGVFDDADADHLAEFRAGLDLLLDGIAARVP